MNAMGHSVPTMLGVQQQDVAEKISKLIPSYMAMGENGMAEMGMMSMPLPENTLPMMTGEGPFGSLEMGGMFSVMKVRKNQKPGDYRDPGWYRQPAGTAAYEYHGNPGEPVRADSAAAPDAQAQHAGHEMHQHPAVEVQVVKPLHHSGH